MADVLVGIGTLALAVSWVIYPLVMAIVSRVYPRRPRSVDAGPPAASIVIATRDEVETVATRIVELRHHCEELSRCEIIVAVDAAADRDTSEYRDRLGSRVQVVSGDAPGGKAMTLNAGVRAATQDVVIFTDSAQEFVAGTLASLVRIVQAPQVGAATGQFKAMSNRPSLLLRAFWTYETWLRNTESDVDSLVGVTGAVYAINRSLWVPLPPGLINDDLYVPLSIVAQGSRVVSCRSAFAIDRRTFTAMEEYRRKVRTLTGILQLCRLRPEILNPLRNRLWLQFICHKLLRFATPYWILLTVIGIAMLLPARVVLLVAGFLAAALALIYWAPPASARSQVGRQLGWAALILWAPLVASANALRGDWDVWRVSRPSAQRESTKARPPAAMP